MQESSRHISRRGLVGGLVAGATLTGGLVTPQAGWAARHFGAQPRSLSLYHIHTREQLDITYHDGADYNRGSLNMVNEFMRDWRQEEIWRIDPNALDILSALSKRLRPDEPLNIICGYRSPRTNALLNARTSGVATRSLHMIGKAIDFVMPDRDLDTLYNEAVALGVGGVGIYSGSRFIHVDTGPVRSWGS